MSNKGSVAKLLGNKVFISLLALAAVIVTFSAISSVRTDKTAVDTNGGEIKAAGGVSLPEKDVLAETEADGVYKKSEPENSKTAVSGADSPEVVYKMPQNGEVQREFSGNSLVWDETMCDWRTHNGVDIASVAGDEVDTAACGTVVFAEKDESFGYTVEIDHQNGVTTVYKNLGKIVVKEGDYVDDGQMIGTVGDGAPFESAQEPHLHFEVKENGVYKNPINFVNKQ